MSNQPSDSALQMKQEFGRILEESLNEIYIFDAESLQYLVVNRGARKNLGYSMEELRELTPLDIQPEYTRESFDRLVAPLRSSEQHELRFNTVHRRKDNTLYDADVQLQLSTSEGRPVFVAFVWDTTERRHAAELRRESEARMQAILDTAVEAIVVIDERGICESVNQAAMRMFGYAADEITGRNVSMLMPSPYREEHDEYIASYLCTGEQKIIGIGREVVGRRKDGSEFPIHLSVSEVQLGDHRLFTGMVQDITDRKEAERRLVQSERLAAVGEAMTSLAHESRNLLQKIQMAVEFGRLEVGSNEDAQREFDTIEKASDGLQALLDEVRGYVAPIQLERSPVSLPEVWREAWQSLEREHRDRDARLQEEVHAGSVTCRVDRFRLMQVFRNLLENSLAACADPVEIWIAVSEWHTSDGGTLRIAVRDNGPGLTAEQKRRVFEPFFTTKSKGTGLGMAIAQRIIDAHGGRIVVGDGHGRGAEFHIQLPR